MAENKPASSWRGNYEKALAVGRIPIAQVIKLDHKTSPDLESSRLEENEQKEEHTAPETGDGHERNA